MKNVWDVLWDPLKCIWHLLNWLCCRPVTHHMCFLPLRLSVVFNSPVWVFTHELMFIPPEAGDLFKNFHCLCVSFWICEDEWSDSSFGTFAGQFLGRCIVQVSVLGGFYSVTLFMLWPLTQQPLGWTSWQENTPYGCSVGRVDPRGWSADTQVQTRPANILTTLTRYEPQHGPAVSFISNKKSHSVSWEV